ncbi:hypothetical protein BDV95DRAFT_578587 [Massariosphaeria phaeospora]|uniref:BTB domain-containing protein n=1 Tax=Massariosphaeria phaeospora TaxID=100035 RepID=A0A7C8M5R1_9PLEO|nr:hypothetical protein BDV95DRAFT_578587 [Massariosphaeria phaeospora]
MGDSTFFFNDVGRLGAKRKRFSLEEGSLNPHKEPASVIPDARIPASKGLRLNCDTLDVVVGTGVHSETFKVHELALCDRSGYFRNAMKPEWASQRANPRVVELPDDDPEAFSIYQTWLYSRQLAILPDACDTRDAGRGKRQVGGGETESVGVGAGAGPSHPGGDSMSDSFIAADSASGFHALAYAYVLGERLLDTSFQNAIADAYVLYARGAGSGDAATLKRYYPSNEDIRIIYEGTSEGNPMRQLLVDIWSCRGKAEWLSEGEAELPRDFLLMVTRALLKGRPSVEGLTRPWKNRHVQYHGGGGK